MGSGFGSHNSDRFPSFLWMIVTIECICLVMFCWLLLKLPSIRASLTQRDSSLQLMGVMADEGDETEEDENDFESNNFQEPLLQSTYESDNENVATHRPTRVISYLKLWRYS